MLQILGWQTDDVQMMYRWCTEIDPMIIGLYNIIMQTIFAIVENMDIIIRKCRCETLLIGKVTARDLDLILSWKGEYDIL